MRLICSTWYTIMDEDDFIDNDASIENAFELALENCGVLDFDTGACLAAGSEDCEFYCAIRRMIERGDFDGTR